MACNNKHYKVQNEELWELVQDSAPLEPMHVHDSQDLAGHDRWIDPRSPGSDGDFPSLQDLNRMVDSLTEESYSPDPDLDVISFYLPSPILRRSSQHQSQSQSPYYVFTDRPEPAGFGDALCMSPAQLTSQLTSDPRQNQDRQQYDDHCSFCHPFDKFGSASEYGGRCMFPGPRHQDQVEDGYEDGYEYGYEYGYEDEYQDEYEGQYEGHYEDEYEDENQDQLQSQYQQLAQDHYWYQNQLFQQNFSFGPDSVNDGICTTLENMSPVASPTLTQESLYSPRQILASFSPNGREKTPSRRLRTSMFGAIGEHLAAPRSSSVADRHKHNDSGARVQDRHQDRSAARARTETRFHGTTFPGFTSSRA